MGEAQRAGNPMTSTASIRDHIVDTAGALFYREGTRSVGVDRIIQETGVAKATMYRHFAGKDALVAACLQRRHERVMEALCGGVEKVPAGGYGRVLAIFDLLHQKASTPEFRGCAFMLAVAENESSDEVRSIARKHKKEVLDLFAAHLPPAHPEIRKDAAKLNLLYDGAMAQILIQRDAQAALLAKECARLLLMNGKPSESSAAGVV